MENKKIGSLGEEMTCSYLKDRQFVVLEQNYRNRYAEIDVIALKGDTVHFIEVKTRCSEVAGRAFEAVPVSKQNRIRRLAEIYLADNDLCDKNVEFHVVTIDLHDINYAF